jgi:pyrrolysyl-tRNA synthetase-like protein
MERGCAWSQTQRQRLVELRAEDETLSALFASCQERDRQFQQCESRLAGKARETLNALFATGGRAAIGELTEKLVNLLVADGFRQVVTPTVISRTALAKMTIDESHPLFSQIFWLDSRKGLRPMLAPGLYSLMQDFGRLKIRPLSFFEVGSCFRKETDGAKHASEFTMLNLVEMGLLEGERQQRLLGLAENICKAAGLSSYEMELEDSVVYGQTLDIVVGEERVEIASGAMGPHPLDGAWDVSETWIGMGFGLERLLMLSRGDNSIGRWCRSTGYHDGIRLKC